MNQKQPELHHHEAHFQGSDLVRDIVIGMADGLTVPFALAAGLSAAVANNDLVITAGIAEIAAGSIAMGLGGYLAGKTELDHYDAELRREYEEVEKFPEKEKEEVREALEGYGLSKKTLDLVVDEMAQNKDKWVEFMMRFELGLEKPNVNRARNSALNIGLSYIVGGLVPLAPYFFTQTPTEGLKISAAVTVITLFIFGYFKSKATGQPPLAGAIRVMIIGVLAAAAAFFVARMLG
jgi:vacuolar iron transporter family protein